MHTTLLRKECKLRDQVGCPLLNARRLAVTMHVEPAAACPEKADRCRIPILATRNEPQVHTIGHVAHAKGGRFVVAFEHLNAN